MVVSQLKVSSLCTVPYSVFVSSGQQQFVLFTQQIPAISGQQSFIRALFIASTFHFAPVRFSQHFANLAAI